MQELLVENLLDEQQALLSRAGDPVKIILSNGEKGVWIPDSLWKDFCCERQNQASSSALEKAVDLLVQESKQQAINQRTFDRQKEQFFQMFSLSDTPMRIEDWGKVRAYLSELGGQRQPS